MSHKPAINLSHLNINEVINNKKERAKATFVFNCEGSYYCKDGEIISISEFESLYPIDIIKHNPKGTNVDGTHIK